MAGRQAIASSSNPSHLGRRFDLVATPDWAGAASSVVEPFIQLLADKGILPLDKALRLLSDKTRLGYLPLEKYDPDLELARQFSAATCQRWCVLPFDRMSKSVLVATANLQCPGGQRAGDATPSVVVVSRSPGGVIRTSGRFFAEHASGQNIRGPTCRRTVETAGDDPAGG